MTRVCSIGFFALGLLAAFAISPFGVGFLALYIDAWWPVYAYGALFAAAGLSRLAVHMYRSSSY